MGWAGKMGLCHTDLAGGPLGRRGRALLRRLLSALAVERLHQLLTLQAVGAVRVPWKIDVLL